MQHHGQEKEPLDLSIKTILIREMLDQQEKLEQERGRNLQLISEPQTREPVPTLKNNKQKSERFIAFMKNISE